MDDYWFWVVLTWALIFCVWLWSRKINREIKEVEKDILMIMDKIVFMNVEKHDGKMFAYNAMTNEFICQGADMDELNANFGKRFPGRKGVLVEPDGTKALKAEGSV